MLHARYLIVGGGMTADAAVRGIRELDQEGGIELVGAEPDPPYARPPLTKALWKGEPVESVWKNTKDAGVTLTLGTRAVELDPSGRRVLDDRGGEHTYEKLLLATGGLPRRLKNDGDAVVYFRTLEDYRRVRELADEHTSFAVIGGGFIGSEIAAALAMQGCRVTMLFPENGIGARIFPESLAVFLNAYYREHGVEVEAGQSVAGVQRAGSRVVVQKSNGSVSSDAVIAGLGIIPATELAASVGIEVDDGIVVDDHLRTTKENIFAAGDVARVPVPALGRMRVEHEDNAVTMGHAAGRAMAGDESPYSHLPFFYSDLFDLGYEAVGMTDSRLETVADWKDEMRQGVIYYLDGGSVRGVLLWGVFGQVDAARELILSGAAVDRATLRGRIPIE